MRMAILISVLWGLATLAAAESITKPHVELSYTGIEKAQAESIAAVLSAAHEVYAKEFKADLPETIVVQVTCGPGEPTRLYTDGQDRVYISLPSPDKLAPPSQSGVFNLYGMCHELGHMVMYRVLRDRGWMTSPAAEGWAHYAGSICVDSVFAAQGESIWFTPYDYRTEGTARLEDQLKSKRPSDIARGAGEWQELEELIGRDGFTKLFAAWQAADIDDSSPADALLVTAVKQFPSKQAELERWWKRAGALFVERRSLSGTKAERISSRLLTGETTELAGDDDSSEGKKSIAGGGHARRFEAPEGGPWYVRAVSVYGSRYGRPQDSSKFEIALCDTEMNQIAAWKKPLMTFERGDMKWVRMEVTPTRVPPEFNICLDFQPTGTKGVFVAYDDSTSGHSLVATPGKPGSTFDGGDWMIRVEVDREREANPLTDD
ncbi:MAG: hypothetical protein JXO22_08145 [Phycisphaerae bacterium]|nr:hypothetical protein [Phycisphaerae bacterium]